MVHPDRISVPLAEYVSERTDKVQVGERHGIFRSVLSFMMCPFRKTVAAVRDGTAPYRTGKYRHGHWAPFWLSLIGTPGIVPRRRRPPCPRRARSSADARGPRERPPPCAHP